MSLLRQARRFHQCRSLFNPIRTLKSTAEKDSCGIPLYPTWSVNELLSSYPSPKLSSATINRLYQLSALIPPEEGSSRHAEITKELEEMIRLIEAVKLVDTQGIHLSGRGEKEDSDREHRSSPDSGAQAGHRLLKHASRTMNSFYVVDTQRSR